MQRAAAVGTLRCVFTIYQITYSTVIIINFTILIMIIVSNTFMIISSPLFFSQYSVI